MTMDRIVHNMSSTPVEIAQAIGEVVEELFPKKVRSPDDVKELLSEMPDGSVHNDGGVTVISSPGGEFLDMFNPPEALQEPSVFRLARSIKAGSRAIRSSRVIEVSEFWSPALGISNSYVVRVPLGFITKPDANFNQPTERRYFRELDEDIHDLAREAAARGVFEVSAGVDGSAQRAQLKADLKVHKQWIKDNAEQYGDAARKEDEVAIHDISEAMKQFLKDTGRDPTSSENMPDFLDFLRLQKETA